MNPRSALLYLEATQQFLQAAASNYQDRIYTPNKILMDTVADTITNIKSLF